jgi:Xaa-Pro aminopeptidase
MGDCRLDAVIASSPANVTYVSGFDCWLASTLKEFMIDPGGSGYAGQQNFAVLPLEGDPALIVEPYFTIDTAEVWIRDVWPAGGGVFAEADGDVQVGVPEHLRPIHTLLAQTASEDAIVAIALALEKRGIADGRIGVEFEGMSPGKRADLERRLPRATLLDCTNLFRLVRAVKTDEEIQRLEQAAQIAEQAAFAAFALVGPGSSAADLRRAYRRELGFEGADFDHFGVGPRGLGVASHASYVFSEDDVLFTDWGCRHQSYYSDTGTTLCLTPPTKDVIGRHRVLRNALEAGAAAIRPGVASSSVRAAMWETLSEQGITGADPFGHGIGIEARDYPMLVPNNDRRIRDDCVDIPSDLPLEEGMVFNLEVPVFTLGAGSMQVEQSFVVTGHGSRPLIAQDREAVVIAGSPELAGAQRT